MGQILDNILLSINMNVLNSLHLQFGFKPNHLTSQCTFVAQEVVSYFVKHNSSVYCVLLDASQAFDCVQYMILFEVLLKQNI